MTLRDSEDISSACSETEGLSKFKTGDTCHSHWNVLRRMYRDAKQLINERGASWTNETSMMKLSRERWNEIVKDSIDTDNANKRLRGLKIFKKDQIQVQL
ncbi:hypothetical protein DFH28DRAFT_1125893 [Melampsora americana]|nr:hypothetical protein DFH28DRAFT_1125893 [Melampsora americana]